MNALTTKDPMSADDAIKVLQNSLYPGAKAESVALVLSYCRMNGLDPMLKPVHIVPTSVKIGHKQYEMRDVLMPGIADYRIKAARSNEYGGLTEPEFGPDRMLEVGNTQTRYPEWCKITVYRIVQGEARAFTAREYWLENYATAGRDTEAPNATWHKRAYGQLAKCTEAQALRKAFPEFSGGQPTVEEMEGKTEWDGPTIDSRPESPRAETRVTYPDYPSPSRTSTSAPPASASPAPPAPPTATPKRRQSVSEWLDNFELNLAAAQTRQDVDLILESEEVVKAAGAFTGTAKERFDEATAAALQRTEPSTESTPPDSEPPIDFGEAMSVEFDADEDKDVQVFLANLKHLSKTEAEALDSNAAHRAWLKKLSEKNYKTVCDAITDKVIARMGA
jgi:phage recombination protein Bet